MARIGGRQKGVGNTATLDKLRQHQSKLEKILLDRALAGDIQAIEVCLKRITEMEDKERAEQVVAPNAP